MRILFVYGSTEGHTREICQHLRRVLGGDGHHVAAEEAPRGPPYPDPKAYDAVFVAGSLHVGRFQPNLVRFVQARRAELEAAHSAFVSVSLSAAGHDPDDWEGLGECLARFEHETGWTPKALHHAAGAIRYSQYDFFKRLAIKHIAAQRGQKTVTSRDYDLTDYEALARFCREFVSEAVNA
jgi:menaquinone-dependent protoporphyrinogen oxidase